VLRLLLLLLRKQINIMDSYIGLKRIKGLFMNRGDYNLYRGWNMPNDENGSDEGYLVEYEGSESNHNNHKGYISWSPKKVFEDSYRLSSGLPFGHAVEGMKSGLKFARSGWNGNGMYVVVMPGYPDGIEANENTRNSHGLSEGAILKFRPYFQLFTAQGDVAMWAPSGSDALAEDWVIVIK
jgi:hypothetical protein